MIFVQSQYTPFVGLPCVRNTPTELIEGKIKFECGNGTGARVIVEQEVWQVSGELVVVGLDVECWKRGWEEFLWNGPFQCVV
jgi:hypothetical protein